MKRLRFAIVHFFLLLMIMMCASVASAADFSWTLGENQPLPEVGPSRVTGNIVDANCNTYWDGEQMWVFFTGDATFNRYVGPDMEHLKKLEPSKLVGFDLVHGDDVYWVNGLYVDENGRWYTTVHVEFNYGDGERHERYIGYAVSDDNAATWTFKDVIISGDGAERASEHPGRYETFGDGDDKLIVDEASGYFYVYYMKSLINKEDNSDFKSLHVARSPISAKMAPGSWEKWYNGEWCQPGIAGHESPLFVNPSTAAFVTYNYYLERYVAIGWKKPSNEGFISTCTSLEKNDWTTPQKFADAGKLGWYGNAIDYYATMDSNNMGKKFRLYAFCASAAEPYYFDVEFDKTKPTTGEQQPYFYSDYSGLKGISYLPEYNSLLKIIPDYAYYETFDNGIGEWKADGAAELSVYRQQNVLGVQNGNFNDTESETEAEPETEIEPEAEDEDTESKKPEDNTVSVVYNKNIPHYADGFLRFTLRMDEGKQFGIYLKYIDEDNYYLVRYNDGKFTLENSTGVLETIYNNYLKNEYAYGLKFEFANDRLIFKIDENVVYDGHISGFDGSLSAPFAFASYPDTFINYDDIVFYSGLRVEIDGFEIAFDTEPVNLDGRVVVPMRRIFELFGAEVSYDEAARTVTAVKDNTKIVLTVDSNTAYVNDEPVELDTSAVIRDDRLLVPIRFISETLNADVEWNGEEQKVLINSNGNLFIKLPEITPWETVFADPNEGLYVEDYFNNLNTTFKNEGIFGLTNDNRPEYELRSRIMRRNDHEKESVARIYDLKTDIKDVVIRAYCVSDDLEGYYSAYISKDGETWNTLRCKSTNTLEDPKRAGMFIFDIVPTAAIPEGYRYLKIELLPRGEYWRNQLGNVKINCSSRNVDTDLSDGLTDKFATLTLIKEKDGDFMIEQDDRASMDCLNRVYRKSSTSPASLVYEVPFAATEIDIRTYTNTNKPQAYFEVYTSPDGVNWSKETMTAKDFVTDTVNTKMSFANLFCSIEQEKNVKYVKVVCLANGENWCNQLVKIDILP